MLSRMAELAGFLVVAAVVICTPGQDTALTIRNALAGGRRSGLATALGVALGQAVRRLLARERVRHAFDALTGVVLVALGLRVAATRG